MAASSSPRIQGHKPIDISSALRANPNLDITEEEFAKTTSYVEAIGVTLHRSSNTIQDTPFQLKGPFLPAEKKR